MTPTVIAVAMAMGLGMGLLGGGGSIIVVPALTFLLHFPAKDAVATSLVVVGLVAATGAAAAFARGALPMLTAMTVASAATIGSLVGSAAGAHLADRTQLTLLGVMMFAAAIAMWQRPSTASDDDRQPQTALLVAIGVTVGALTGLAGVGGGFLIVPALVGAARLPIKSAAAASLLVITIAAWSAIPNYLSQTTLRWSFIAPFAGVAAIGVVAGGIIGHRLPQRPLQQAFAIVLVIVGSYVLIQA
jgi:uncharacterized membrane protein YfcA